ncbi:hypothetical protein QBC41DRAFT_8279 [Cercophora samala]|uniref:Uncharacterized protein n=1 Tax=Cercophora samala TaxID=330535 RepID=A0AA39Z7Y4_9PEZI|nr:hypothetical protein QBC41DRAFT_8279 [Cercophora samala]
MDPDDVYPSKPLDHTEPSSVTTPPQQQYNGHMPDAPGLASQDQDVDLADTPPESPEEDDCPDDVTTTTQTLGHSQHQEQDEYTEQHFLPAPNPPQQLPGGHTGQAFAMGQQPAPSNLTPPPTAPPAQAQPALVHSPSVILSYDLGYQHDLQPLSYHYVHGDITHEYEFIPMVYTSSGGDTRLIWEVVKDGRHLNYTGHPSVPQ